MNADIRKRLRELRGDTNLRWVKGDRVGEPSFIMEVDDSLSPEEFLAQTGGSVADSICHTDAEVVVEFFNSMPDLLDDVDRLEAENAALKARVAELEGEITELTAPFSSGDPTKLTESEWARIHENVEKYAPKTPHVQVDKDGVWFIRLDLFASITEKLEARVAVLEEVRKAAVVVAEDEIGEPGGNPFVCYFCGCHSPSSMAPWRHRDGCPMSALRAALDRANKENQ